MFHLTLSLFFKLIYSISYPLCMAGIPTDCDEARWRYHISYDTPVLIDVDGPDEDEAGNLSPFLAHCDMTSYLHVGVTEIPHDM